VSGYVLRWVGGETGDALVWAEVANVWNPGRVAVFSLAEVS
jgi:hypothetical protein